MGEYCGPLWRRKASNLYLLTKIILGGEICEASSVIPMNLTIRTFQGELKNITVIDNEKRAPKSRRKL